jgi:hypothetical protein
MIYRSILSRKRSRKSSHTDWDRLTSTPIKQYGISMSAESFNLANDSLVKFEFKIMMGVYVYP